MIDDITGSLGHTYSLCIISNIISSLVFMGSDPTDVIATGYTFIYMYLYYSSFFSHDVYNQLLPDIV